MTLFSDKTISSEKITLVEGEKTFTQDATKTEILDTFFSNILKNYHIRYSKRFSNIVKT